MINATNRRIAVELITEAVNAGAALYKACAELGISKRTYNRWKNTDSDYIDKRTMCVRPEPPNKLSVEERKKILEIVNSADFSSKTPCEIVPILADRGIYLFSRKIVGWEVWECEDAKHASGLIRRIYRDEKVYLNKEPLVLHSDNGSPMKGATMMETLYTLGIIPSRSRPRVSNDNPYAESLFKTLKYVPNYQPKWFASLEEARVWVKHFVEWYNNEHRHSGINYVTPNERYNGMDKEILEKRKIVYEQAKAEHPERWAKETRDWTCAEEEWLNPRQENEIRKGA